ncbi:MAG: hypothetical protein NZM27_11260 [Acetobacteraceae bacterium]|nr:hypothetical protein [Acetobacteraceae bacterium]MDW8397628.1 hypothetical protein [Acetobacteraceae bacterium]
MRRMLAPLLLLPLVACAEALVPAAAVNVGALAVAGRTVPDIALSLALGRDCSVAHVETEGVYCRRRAEAQPPPPLCTRSLGAVDCWTALPATSEPRRGLADGPPPAAEAPPWPWGLIP